MKKKSSHYLIVRQSYHAFCESKVIAKEIGYHRLSDHQKYQKMWWLCLTMEHCNDFFLELSTLDLSKNDVLLHQRICLNTFFLRKYRYFFMLHIILMKMLKKYHFCREGNREYLPGSAIISDFWFFLKKGWTEVLKYWYVIIWGFKVIPRSLKVEYFLPLY